MTVTHARPALRAGRMPIPVRAAQAVLLLPMGLLQVVAVPAFSISLGLHTGRDWAVATLGLFMAFGTVAAGFGLRRREPRMLRAALGVLAVQTLFSVIKLTAYHEQAALVFLALTAVATALVVLPASRAWFRAG
jgi:peptidoglycan/LPS O-acetylase OafA/YrhL